MTGVLAAVLPRALSRRVARPGERTASFGDLVHTRWEHKQNLTDKEA